MLKPVIALALALAFACFAGTSASAAGRATGEPGKRITTQYRVAHERQILRDFSTLLSLRNVATDSGDIARNAAYLRAELSRRGFATRELSAGPDTPVAVYGELKTPGARRTLILYAHFDGQPAGQEGWVGDPWTPTIRANASPDAPLVSLEGSGPISPEARIYARSASDDKVAIQALFSALDALRAAGRRPSVNVKIFYEGEEEHGSLHLESLLDANRQLLSGDLFILGDGPRYPSGAMQLILGARGASTLDLTVYGPGRPLHSGHFGNWAPNPAAMLSHLLADMRAEDGTILIPGFGDRTRKPTDAEIELADALPDIERGLREDLLINRPETAETLARAVFRPALNIRGIRVGDVGERASNTIFTEARASIDFRSVPDQTPGFIRERTEAYLRQKGWHIVYEDPSPALRAAHARIVKLEWTPGYPAYRGAADLPSIRTLAAIIERSIGERILLNPTIGGSVPMHIFSAKLNVPVVILPVANYDNNQHAANENLRLQNLWDAIEIYANVLTDAAWRK